MELPAIVYVILAVPFYATLTVRRYVRLHRRWDVMSTILGLLGAGAAIAANQGGTVGWFETALVAALLAVLPFALISYLVTLGLGFRWLNERIIDRQAARHGADHPRTRHLRALRDMADDSWQRWMGPR